MRTQCGFIANKAIFSLSLFWLKNLQRDNNAANMPQKLTYSGLSIRWLRVRVPSSSLRCKEPQVKDLRLLLFSGRTPDLPILVAFW
jgi:hypothetical protein